MQQFDPNFTGTPPFEIRGDVTSVKVLEGGVLPNHVVDPTKQLEIEVEWKVDGGSRTSGSWRWRRPSGA